jgi:hypothetical protein
MLVQSLPANSSCHAWANLTKLADGRRGTASALASSEAEKDRGFFYRRGMRGGAHERLHSHALFRGARQARNRAHGGAKKFTSFTWADGAVMVPPQSGHFSRSTASEAAVNRRPNQRISPSVAVEASHTGHAQSGHGTPVTSNTGTQSSRDDKVYNTSVRVAERAVNLKHSLSPRSP